MGNKLSCSCAPLIKRAYRYEDSPWQSSRRREGHLLRLWAEVFHVSASGMGSVKWQQVSEDLVPVNITCVQEGVESVFHITAYNSQVDKILDVRLIQPGTRIGQASECFVYWKDPITSDTWGLNFTSSIDAKQFRECCVSIRPPGRRAGAAQQQHHQHASATPAGGGITTSAHSPPFKFSRKASSSYSLKLDPPGKQKVKVKRKPLSTPASPSRAREPQCTCMTPEQYARLRAQDPRYRGSSTLPRTTTRGQDVDSSVGGGKVAAATSSTSLYDNMGAGGGTAASAKSAGMRQGQQVSAGGGGAAGGAGAGAGTTATQASRGTQDPAGQGSGQTPAPVARERATQDSATMTTQKVGEGMVVSEGTQAGIPHGHPQHIHMTPGKSSVGTSTSTPRVHHILTATKSMDYQDTTDAEMRAMHHRNMSYNNNINNINNNFQSMRRSMASNKSKSTDDMRATDGVNIDSNTLKRMLKPMGSAESPVTSPEMSRRRYNHYNNNTMEVRGRQAGRFSASRSSHEIGRGGGGYQQGRGLYLELERNGGHGDHGGGPGDVSPPSDNVLFDNQCYATTPSSSNGNSDMEQPPGDETRPGPRDRVHRGSGYPTANSAPTPGSPTSRLLLEYERHLRNTLAKGMDAESYSLRTFEALLSQSMENLEFAESLPGSNQRSPYPNRRRMGSKCSTLPVNLSQRLSVERPASSRDGYYSDRNELARERERERERERDRERGYMSDHNARCASCLGESARAQWFRHSDGWRSGSSAYGSGTSSTLTGDGRSTLQRSGGHRRSPWDSLPSLRQEGSVSDSGYKNSRADSFDQRSIVLDRQDSLRSDYMSDRDGRYGIVQQASIESTDSRLCYLTSSEISDDDRMSLTTAVSDEDDPEGPEGDSVHNSPYRAKQMRGDSAASFNCTGAVRKAGFLSVKKWLLRKKHQIELARKRGWKGYWVCLKGTTLLFYPCDSREGRSVEAAPKHLIIVDGAIMQPIPEHPKRDYIFCLSTAFGDAYLFQAPCQVELENWVNSIHSACAAAFARHRGKTGTLHLLQEEIFRLDKAIDQDCKLKHLSDSQQPVAADSDVRAHLSSQILQLEENVERLHCEQFRLRCYMASLQNGELPNPKSLLTHVSRATKATLNKLGVFTVSSFHAFICARSPSLLNNLLAGRGATKRRPLLSRSNSASSRRSMQMSSRDDPEHTVKVSLPEGQVAHVHLRENMSVEEYLASACSRRNLNPVEHFVRVKKRRDMEDHNYFVPHRTDQIETYLHTHEVVEVCAKILYQVELQRNTIDQMWGFSVEAELIENAERQDELCCYVSRVEDKSVAMHNGIIKGDEIMVINGAIVSDLDMMYLESVLQEEVALCMMMRSSRTEPPDLATMMRGTTDDMIESLVCPPPPSEPPTLSEEMISGLIVPAPGWSKEMYSPEQETSPLPSGDGIVGQTGVKVASRANSFEIENLLKTAEQVTGFCRSPVETRKLSPTGSVTSQSQALLTPSRQLTDAEKLRKVIIELVDTERTYVKHLNSLLENYLEPLKKETFLSGAEISALFGNIQEIVAFQRQFLHSLEEALRAEPVFHEFEHPSQFKNVLFSIGNAFLYYVNHFKLYSSFCASHSKAQKVLHPNEGNQALQQFLADRNPRQQHSSTLESYLIKPIQRILKYPLLLQQLRNLTDPQSEQHQHLVEALKGMEKVAEHINEMQRIHEEYGAIFDHLFRQHQKSCKQPIDLSPGDLLYYGGVEWLNISDFLGKIKKGLELHAMCFVFKSAVVFLCKERLRQKKKLMGVSSKGSSNEVEIIRYQVLIPVTEVQVRASSAKDMDSHFLWELIHLRSQLQRRSEKVYVLSNSTADFRNAFLKTIRQIIRESVRNMSLPSTKPSGSGGSGGSGNGSSSGPNMQGGADSQHTAGRGQTGAGGGVMQGSQTLGKTRKVAKNAQRHSAGNVDYDNVESDSGNAGMASNTGQAFRSRSRTVSDVHDQHGSKGEFDPGTKSEGEEDGGGDCGVGQCAGGAGAVGVGGGANVSGGIGSSATTGRIPKATLGRTPNHLTLSTTSTLSAGSTGSQARLIQSSQHPENYQPPLAKDLGSPVWKPRDMIGSGEATTLPRKGKPSSESAGSAGAGASSSGTGRERCLVYEEFPSATLRSTRSHK